ncbi:MAG: hypothetical protein OER90_05465 [Gemmatimonadota bacterium]|nr:hypothetical protein [Gemmatimonadota bacterium]
MRAVALLAAFLLAPLADALGQELPLQPGQRVRVTVPNLDVSKQETQFQRLNRDTLVVSSASYALSDVTRLDVWRGQRSVAGKGALFGFVGGAVVGAVVGYSLGDSEGFCVFACSAEAKGAWGAGIGGGAGAISGLLIGALIKTDKWERVAVDRLRVSVVPRRDGFGVGASIAF